MRTTILDIAKNLGLSPTTISRVLNGRESSLVSETTRTKVMQTALEMGYTPNRMARALVTGRSQSIALWVWGVHPSYYSSTIHHISRILNADNYETHVVEVGSTKSLMDVCSWPVDGILAFDCAESVHRAMQIDNLIRVPVVTLGTQKLDNVDYVCFDLTSGVQAAMQHLIDTGSKRISMLFGGRDSNDIRTQGYVEAMKAAGLECDMILSDKTSAPHVQSHYAYVRMCQYLAECDPPEAIFCFNDQTAIGAYRALYEHGLKIPDDVAVVGCDGIDMSEYLYPKLTTIIQPSEEMCSRAWQFLRNRIDNPDLPQQGVTLTCKLDVRESSRIKRNTL